MSSILPDVKFALRTFARSPLFTGVAILSLALGIGANTAIFTLIDRLMLRLLPVKDPHQLVMIWTTGPHMGNNRGARASSYPMYQEFQSRSQAFSHVFCRFFTPLAISIDNRTERVNAEMVSGNYFQALGVGAAAGRVLTPDEDDRAWRGHPVVVLSHDYWVSRFDGDPAVIGKKMLVNNHPMIIVGVSAAGFHGLDPSRSPQVRLPIQMKPDVTPGWDDLGNRRSQWIQIFARLKDRQTVDSARASLQGLFSQVLRDELGSKELSQSSEYLRKQFVARQIRMEPADSGYSPIRERVRIALVVLMCMVGLVLLIACSNVANLLIARAAARQKEIAVRLAVGASRAQLIRQLLVESLLLSMAGGLLGIALAMWVTRGLLSFVPQDGTPFMLRAEPDWRVLAFSLVISILTGALFGLAPAYQALRVDLWNTLKDVVGAVAGSGGSVRLRKALVAAQVALSFLLLAGAGLFVKSLANLRSTDSGFRDMNNLITFQVDPALNGYSLPRIRTFYKQLLDNLRSVPGVQSASFASVPLLHGFEWDSSMTVEGHQSKDGEDMQAFMNSIAPEYWRTMGVSVLEGRDFDARDEGGDTFKVAIVNRKFAGHYFPGRSPIGRKLGFGSGPDSKLNIEIIGMVEDSLYEGPREGVRRQVFVPNLQSRFPGAVSFYLRAGVDSAAVYSAVRREVGRLDATMPIYELKTLEHQLDETLSTERLIAVLSASFGALATILAAIGLYGVMAFVVARRTKEIGLRMALGAQQGAVVWLVMREVLMLLGIGVAFAVPCAYLLSRYLESQLFGVGRADFPTALAAAGILAAVAIAAGLLPAKRASAIDPIRALRYE